MTPKAAWPRSRVLLLKQWDRYPCSTERISCLKHILASPVYAPGTIAVNVTRLERGFNVCKTPRCIPICLQPFLRYSKLLVENCDIFVPQLCLAAPQGVTPLEFREDLDIHKTRMNGLSCGEESMTICSAVLIQYQRVTDRRTDVQPIAKTCFSIADARKNLRKVSKLKHRPVFLRHVV